MKLTAKEEYQLIQKEKEKLARWEAIYFYWKELCKTDSKAGCKTCEKFGVSRQVLTDAISYHMKFNQFKTENK